jgi:hypothetical protein
VLRYRFLEPFYSDLGTLPTDLLLEKIDFIYKLVCLHCHLGALWHQQVLLAIQIGLAVLFACGVGTSWTTLLSWYLYTSLTLRNTWLNYILDRYFHYLLFLSVFLPLQRRDCRRRDRSPSPPQQESMSEKSNTRKKDKARSIVEVQVEGIVVSPATVALKALVIWIYLDAGWGKYMDPLGGWSWNAQPLPALDTYARHTTGAQYLYAILQPVGGFRILTPAVVYLELLSAPLALVSSYCGWWRIVHSCVYAMWSLHIGIALTLRNSAMLSWVACSAWIPFLMIYPTAASSNVPQRTPPRTDVAAKSVVRHRQRAAQWTSSIVCIAGLGAGSLWFEQVGCKSSSEVQTVWSTLLHNRWNVFVGAEEYVTWEIAPGLLQDGSIVDVWGRTNAVDWTLPGSGSALHTATARPGRWRSFPYLAELRGRYGEALWGYLCREWDRDNRAGDNPGRKLVRYNFFMLQADVLPNMMFSPTRKRLIRAFECATGESGSHNKEITAEIPIVGTSNPENQGFHPSSEIEL